MAFYREDYHEQYPSWREGAVVGAAIGIELELEHDDGYEAMLDCLVEPSENEGPTPITEADGSLSDERGLEIVFPPYKPDVIKDKGSYFAKLLKLLDDAGAESTRRCGLHMNVNTSRWSEERKLTFCAVIHHLPTIWLKRIGGRSPSGEYAHRHVGRVNIYERTPYGLTEMKDNRIECRFPASTLDHDKIVVLTDFLVLLSALAGKSKFCKNVKNAIDEAEVTGGEQSIRFRKIGYILIDELNAMIPSCPEAAKVVEVLTDEEAASTGASEATATRV